MAFKKMRGVNLPYNKQGYIFFHCKEYNSLSEQDKQYIVNLCKEQCGDYWQAVF